MHSPAKNERPAHPRSWLRFPLPLAALVAGSLALGATSARASVFFLEPGASVHYVNSTVLATKATAGDSVIIPELDFRAGLERENMFASVDISGSMADLRGLSTGMKYTLGVTGGGTFVSIPIRLFFGLDLLNNYSDDTVTLGGLGYRFGATYFFSEAVGLSLIIAYNNYNSISFATDPVNAVGTRYGTMGLGISFPLYLKSPSGQWRPQRDELAH